ncbi:MAG: response regulator [Pseudomonadota bacterium]
MSIASQIAPELPYLRRFARALTGSQQSGDAYVASALEALIADPSLFSKDLRPRVAIYNVFMRIWGSIDVNQEHDERATNATQSVADRRLDALTPAARQAFLLVAVEGFEPEDAAAVLNVSRDELTTMIDKAGQEMSEQVATNVLIIEDEPLIAMELEDLVKGLGHDVARVARTHKEAIAAVKQATPGLVLADIQLADGSSGLEAVNEILQSIDVPVIFITAFPERLLTGERPEPAFLIAKPFEADMVKAVISQALFFERRTHAAA